MSELSLPGILFYLEGEDLKREADGMKREG